MTTSPLFQKSATLPEPVSPPPAPTELDHAFSERLHRLEGEVAELRETVARFAEVVLGEVKNLRESHAETPMLPAMAGEFPVSEVLERTGESSKESSATSERRPWLLMELLHDFGSTFRMYLDPRYRVRRSTQLMVPVILGLFVLNCFFFNTVFTMPLVSAGLEKLFDIILAILLYKVLNREVQRYRLALAQIVAWHAYRERTTTIVVGAEPATTRLETE